MNVIFEPQETEERADHVTAKELMDLTADSDFFRHIREKLLGRGAKLISGPRGTGKTHQMRYVYLECTKHPSHPVAVYVSFSRYARLEPLLRTAVDALKIFHSWVLAKIVLGVDAFGRDSGHELGALIMRELGVSVEQLDTYIAEVENGDRLSWHESLQPHLNMARMHALLRSTANTCNRSRIVLLLDDAALSLTPEYLVEFFNIFQDLKSPSISPKASVYPGTTQYGPRFHVRHDAEMVNVWLSVEESDYSEVMGELLSKRPTLSIGIPPDVVELFKYLAFGVPRVLLTMLRAYGQLATHAKSTIQQNVNTVVEEQVRLLQAEYQSLAYKLPQFKSVIGAGFRLFNTIADEIVDDNRRLHKSA